MCLPTGEDNRQPIEVDYKANSKKSQLIFLSNIVLYVLKKLDEYLVETLHFYFIEHKRGYCGLHNIRDGS